MKKERPILFSTPMVEAIYNGTKNQTRRDKGLDTINENPDNWQVLHYTLINNKTTVVLQCKQGFGYLRVSCPYGKTDDTLWVRETFIKLPEDDLFTYKANSPYQISLDLKQDILKAKGLKWKPSIHMPRKAARLFLRIADISLERLNDISKEDARGEGVLLIKNNEEDFLKKFAFYPNYMPTQPPFFKSPITSFMTLWDSINGKSAYSKNPWVWVIKFKTI